MTSSWSPVSARQRWAQAAPLRAGPGLAPNNQLCPLPPNPARPPVPAQQGGPRAAPLESWSRGGTHHSTVPTTSEISMPTGASPAWRTPSPPLKSGTPLAPHRHERTQFNVRSCWRCLQHEPCSLDVLSSAPIALAETKPAAQTHSNSASNLLPPPGKQSRHPDQLALAPGNEPNSASLIPACLPVPAQ